MSTLWDRAHSQAYITLDLRVTILEIAEFIKSVVPCEIVKTNSNDPRSCSCSQKVLNSGFEPQLPFATRCVTYAKPTPMGGSMTVLPVIMSVDEKFVRIGKTFIGYVGSVS